MTRPTPSQPSLFKRNDQPKGKKTAKKKKASEPAAPFPPERTSAVVTAIEQAYAALQDVWPELPNVAVTVFYDRRRRNRGYYWRHQWVYRAGRLPELHIDSTILRESPESILETLVHESAHGRAHALRIQETSREGRYHNRRFAELAREMGLVAESDRRIGHRTTEIVPEWLAGKYKPALEIISEASGKLWQGTGIDRRPGGNPDGDGDGTEGDDGGDDKRPAQRMLKAICQCAEPRIIRVARSIFDVAPIVCQKCRQPFALTAK
jgi:hypothetical protein